MVCSIGWSSGERPGLGISRWAAGIKCMNWGQGRGREEVVTLGVMIIRITIQCSICHVRSFLYIGTGLGLLCAWNNSGKSDYYYCCSYHLSLFIYLFLQFYLFNFQLQGTFNFIFQVYSIVIRHLYNYEVITYPHFIEEKDEAWTSQVIFLRSNSLLVAKPEYKI